MKLRQAKKIVKHPWTYYARKCGGRDPNKWVRYYQSNAQVKKAWVVIWRRERNFMKKYESKIISETL